MKKQAKKKREKRTITIDFNDEETYHELCKSCSGFIEFVVAYIMSLGLQLKHKCACQGGFKLPTIHIIPGSGWEDWSSGGCRVKSVRRSLPSYPILSGATVGSNQPWPKRPSWPRTVG